MANTIQDRAGLDRLPVEVIQMITSNFDASPPWTKERPTCTPLKSMSLTCHALRASTVPRLYNHTKILVTVKEQRVRPAHIVTVRGFCALVIKKNLQKYIIGVALYLIVPPSESQKTAIVKAPSLTSVTGGLSTTQNLGFWNRTRLYRLFMNILRRLLIRACLRFSSFQTFHPTLTRYRQPRLLAPVGWKPMKRH